MEKPNAYKVAWDKLYKLFTERLGQEPLSVQDTLDAMDGTLCGVEALIQYEMNRR